VGLFSTDGGVFTGGGWTLLGVQLLGLIALCAWGFVTTWIGLKVISLVVPLRSTEEEEEVGLDISYHGIMAAHQAPEFIEYENYYAEVKEKAADS
jgi:Amt family ammonium transporter